MGHEQFYHLLRATSPRYIRFQIRMYSRRLLLWSRPLVINCVNYESVVVLVPKELKTTTSRKEMIRCFCKLVEIGRLIYCVFIEISG